jgi:hypothetical protein
MALNLNQREIPVITFTRKLPRVFGPSGVAGYEGKPVDCYITVNARPAGHGNVAYSAMVDRMTLMQNTSARKIERMAADPETAANDGLIVAEQIADRVKLGLAWTRGVYDTCVIDWVSNIQDGGKDIEPTAENFIALFESGHPALIGAVNGLRNAIDKAGIDLAAADAALLKN